MDPSEPAGDFDALFRRAFVAEVAKKSGLLWIVYADAWHPVWHVWHEDAVCVVAGGDEQPLPGIRDEREVVLDLRAKSTRAQVARVSASVEEISPDHPEWEEVTAVLAADRLNLFEADEAVARWARECVVVRLRPMELLSSPGHLDDRAQREQPLESPARTVRSRPFALHRQRRAPRLSGSSEA
ncbi:hypothetical protein KV102_11685 [Mumia sp. zg.B53]|uniref:hypothetical protein n=1 Tax=unclassified Mumia TaxID=2621872 RepID=UPI001C6E8A80|nr:MULTISPECIES: hypothetical protein [unclassified Mumia]MBW9206776.1 hypothetical protein [Mumia sp. zg.B17]MBW9210936.1 hypothetical protein [Mumia sp. zg.B21]MBW9215502.1 hypothetical protein [Mumia sp. zg.B53]MDD9347292.1 hypothetical protein [Mumia sp.]